MKQTYPGRKEVSELMAENERLRAENERLSMAVCSGILADLLDPDESEALLAFVKELRLISQANRQEAV